MAAVVLALAVLLSALAHQPGASPLPHVSKCRLCMHCHLTDKAPEQKGSNEVDESKLQLVRRQLRADERYEDEDEEGVAEGGGAQKMISAHNSIGSGGGSAGSSTDGGRAAGDGQEGDGTASGQEDSWAGDQHDEEQEGAETYEGPLGTGGSRSLSGSRSSSQSGSKGGGAAGSKGGVQSSGPERTLSAAGSGKPRAPPRPPGRLRKPPPYDPNADPTVPVWFRPASYQALEHAHTAHLPACRECWGCTHNLTLISSATTFLNTIYVNEKGQTSSWVFKANTNMTRSGEAVVKAYCVPLHKQTNAMIRPCHPGSIVEKMKLLMALDKLSVECGFTVAPEDLIPRMWLAPVSGVIPGLGYPINWWGLWMEYVDGAVSLENLLHKGLPQRLPNKVVLDLLGPKLNRTKVVRAAIFDLLTSQCDRHAGNIMVKEDGNFKLIDNGDCLLLHHWDHCAFDSLLVPTTQKQESARLNSYYVLKRQGYELPTKGHASPQLLFDYRCYVGSKAAQLVGSAPPVTGLLGTNYPPDIKQCLTRIAGMSAEEVHSHFGFPELRVAQHLHTRAADMLTKGFEWATKYGSPANPPPKKYRFQPPCCRINEKLQCAHPWEPKWELPLGNPATGREWDKPRPDIGKYKGGDFGDTEAFKEKGVAGL